MAEKIKKSSFWVIILAIGILIITIEQVGFKWPDLEVVKVPQALADVATTGVSVGNVAPTVATPILNSGAAITLTASTTASISATTTITDTNGWADISSANAVFYNSTTTEACSADNDDCYVISSCTLGATTTNSRDVTCTADMYYYAIPTDTGEWASNTSYMSKVWIAWIKGIDAANASNTATTSQEVNSLFAVEVVQTNINYGTVAPGATSTTPCASTTAQTTGNAPINSNISGENMVSGANTISITQQKYGLTDVGWETQDVTASSSAQTLDLDSGRTDSTAVASDIVYWAIKIPDAQPTGDYNGTNTIAALEDTIDW